MVNAYCVDFGSIVILQEYSGTGSKYETCVSMAHRILNMPLILTAILALIITYEHLLMYKLHLSRTFVLCKRIRTWHTQGIYMQSLIQVVV
jgi:hypothetical protein